MQRTKKRGWWRNASSRKRKALVVGLLISLLGWGSLALLWMKDGFYLIDDLVLPFLNQPLEPWFGWILLAAVGALGAAVVLPGKPRWVFGSLAILPGFIAGLVAAVGLLAFPQSLTWIVVEVVVLIGLIMLFVGPMRASVEKQRPDLLASTEAVMGARERLATPDGVWCGQLDGESLHASIEDRAVVIGPPGTGKTAFLVGQLLHWADSGRPFVCLDIKPEIYGITREALEGKGYRVLTYNPTERTGQRYNPLADADGPEAVGELAAALIPADSPKDAVFHESARDFLDAIITHLRAVGGEPTLPKVRQFVADADNYRELMRDLIQSPDPDAQDLANGLMMTAANERLLGSIFATFRSNLRFLRFPAVRASLEASDFSLAELATGEPVALFLQFEEKHRETTARLLSALVGHMMRYFIAHTERPALLLLLDEIGNAPPVPALIDKLNTIRSRELPTWLYWQSLEQMQKYGAKAGEGANIILGACDFQMVFRLNDNASAEWMSRRIGVVDRMVDSQSVAMSIGEIMPKRTVSKALVTEPKVFPHELQQLDDTEAICVYRGQAWRGHATPYFELWPEYKGRRPAASDLLDAPYPVAESQLSEPSN